MKVANRGVSSVIGVILMVAVVVILAAIVSVAAFGFVSDINEPAPNVADNGGFVIDSSGFFDAQLVQITHIAGDDVSVEEIEIVVRASGPGDSLPKETRLVALPASGSSLNDKNIRGDLVAQGSGNDQVIDGDPGVTWSSGDTIQFEIKLTEADFRDPPTNADAEADELEVVIVHTPSGAIISQNTFTP